MADIKEYASYHSPIVIDDNNSPELGPALIIYIRTSAPAGEDFSCKYYNGESGGVGLCSCTGIFFKVCLHTVLCAVCKMFHKPHNVGFEILVII